MKRQNQAVVVLTICLMFLFLKYIAQLFPSLISNALIEQFQLTGVQIGVLASSYYYSYTIMQIASGAILDRYDLRISAFIAIMIISIGLLGFAATDSFFSMCLYRVLMGIGCSFATTLYMKLATIWTSSKTFSFISSLLATATMLGAAVGSGPVAALFNRVGWNLGLVYIAYIGLALSILALVYIRNDTQCVEKASASIVDMKNVLLNRTNLWLLLYSGITFSPIIILGGLWGVPFLQLKFSTTASDVATLISVMFVGHAIGSPMWALLSAALQNKKQIMIFANIISFITLILILYAHTSYLQAEALFFIFGFCVGSFMLSFDICRQVNNVVVMGFSVAFINSGEGIVGSVFEPGIGLLLDILKTPEDKLFSLYNYQSALSILPVCYIVSTLIVFKFPVQHKVPNLFKYWQMKRSLN